MAVLALNIDYLNNLSKSSIWTLRKKRSSLHSHLRESLESHFTSGSFKRDDWAACARRPFPLFCKSVESEQSQQFLIHNSIRSMQQSVLFSIEFPSLSNCWKNEKVDWILFSKKLLPWIHFKTFFFWIFAFKLWITFAVNVLLNKNSVVYSFEIPVVEFSWPRVFLKSLAI